MARKSKALEPAVFNIDDYRPDAYADCDVREIDMGNGKTLTVTLEHLTTRQAKRIPLKGPIEGSYKAAARYIRDWDLTATNTRTGEATEIPAPGSPEATEWMGEGNEWELMELLDNATGSQVVLWLVNPAGMELSTERGKSRSTKSAPTDAPPNDSDTTTA